MKIRFWERLLIALGGLCLAAVGLGAGLWSLGLMPSAWLEALAGAAGGGYTLVILAVSILLMLLGIYSFALLFRRARGRKGFVLQKTENGELSISIKAMENLVQKCVDKHEELHVLSTSIQNSRDGVAVALRIGLANGVSIPLAVNSLQKQIKQYITACSGIEVREVRVQVETAAADVKDSPYAVRETELQLEKAPDVPAMPQIPVIQESVMETASQPSAPIPIPEAEEHPKRPLHQRLFGHQEQPAIVPMPPIPAAEEAVKIKESETAQNEAAQVRSKAEEAPEEREAKANEAD